jgi:hypothetical protein
MTPVQQAQLVNSDTGAIADLMKPDRLAPILGSVGGLLMAVNANSKILKTAGVVLTVGSLFYGIATKPSQPEISST